jgi:hypothetical protein
MGGVGCRGWREQIGPGSCDSESSMTGDGLARESRLVLELSSTMVNKVGVDWGLDCVMESAVVVSRYSLSGERWVLETDCLGEGDAVVVWGSVLGFRSDALGDYRSQGYWISLPGNPQYVLVQSLNFLLQLPFWAVFSFAIPTYSHELGPFNSLMFTRHSIE